MSKKLITVADLVIKEFTITQTENHLKSGKKLLLPNGLKALDYKLNGTPGHQNSGLMHQKKQLTELISEIKSTIPKGKVIINREELRNLVHQLNETNREINVINRKLRHYSAIFFPQQKKSILPGNIFIFVIKENGTELHLTLDSTKIAEHQCPANCAIVYADDETGTSFLFKREGDTATYLGKEGTIREIHLPENWMFHLSDAKVEIAVN